MFPEATQCQIVSIYENRFSAGLQLEPQHFFNVKDLRPNYCLRVGTLNCNFSDFRKSLNEHSFFKPISFPPH